MRTFIIVIVAILIISAMICGAVLLVLEDDFKDGNIDFNLEGFKDFTLKARDYEAYDINESFSTSAQEIKEITSHAVVADIEIIKWESDEIKATFIGEISTRGGKPYLEIKESGSSLTLDVKYPNVLNTSTFSSNLKLYIYVPENYENSFELHTVSGNITVAPFDTILKIDLNSVSGKLNIKNTVGNKLFLSSVSGNLNIIQSSFDSCSLSSTSGSTTYTGNPGRLQGNSVSGDFDLSVYGNLNDISIDTVSGEVDIFFDNNASATIILSTVSGDYSTEMPISILSSKNRNISFTVGETPNAKIDISSVSGDLSVNIN